jgi:Fe-S-cluster containining protein
MENASKQPQRGGLTVLRPDDAFRFACHRGLDCYTRCCRDITIFLTPYDIIRMKSALNISSEEFLEKYTLTIIGEAGLPVVLLRMGDDEQKSCPFVTPTGCTIYPDRPWPCRIYPLKPESTKITEKKGREYYSVMDLPFCQGLREQRATPVEQWIEEQGIPIYREMEKLFKKITLNEHLNAQKITNPKIQEMFRMASYDLDRFRRFVFESKFLELFDVAPERAEQMKTDDVELFKFAMTWLEYGLIGKHVLKLKPEVVEAKKQELGVQ